jgi:hypothetical protein
MRTITRTTHPVKSTRGPGRPPLRTPAKEQEITRTCVKEAVLHGQMPSDAELAQRVGLGERTVRSIRLRAGLNRRHIAAWVRAREAAPDRSSTEEVLCWTPYAGLWLLVPLIVCSALPSAVGLLQWTSPTGTDGWQFVLTVLMWAILGFRRFYHLDDFRHRADLGLALFAGRVRLLADSTLWRLVHTLTPVSAQAFYEQTAAQAVPLDVPTGEEWLSMDEHVVGFFTKLKPRPLAKNRVPTRGRSYPAIRLYAPFHIWAGRFVGLVVTKAHCALSQVLPALIAEIRRLRTRRGHPQPRQVNVIIDRGGYKGGLFEALMADEQIRFIAMARATKKNVVQWDAVPDKAFTAYRPAGEQNPNLQIAETTTRITDCQYPLRTVLIRDDTPDTKQRWRALFTKASPEEMTPADVDATYRRRQDHENSFADLDHHLAGKCLPKPYRLVRDANEQGEKRRTVATTLSAETMTGLHLVAWLRHWAYNVVKDLGAALGDSYGAMRVGTLARRLIARPGIVCVQDHELRVTLMPFAGSEVLAGWIQQVNKQQIAIPWLDHLILQIEIAPLPVGLAADPRVVQRRVFANRNSAAAA